MTIFSPGCRPLDESITKDMFKAADTDGDGEISLDEFKTIMRAGPDTKPHSKYVSDYYNGAAVAPKAMPSEY